MATTTVHDQPLDASPAPAAPAAKRSVLGSISVETLIQGAGALAASVGVVYVVGGMVMWLRFRKADLPADQAVALMSRQQLLVIGLRLMVLPALTTGAFAWLLSRRRANRIAAAAAAEPRAVSRTRRVLNALALLALGLFVALLPWSFASLTWLVAAALIAGYQLLEARPHGAGPRPPRTVTPPEPEAESDGPGAPAGRRARVLAAVRRAVVHARARLALAAQVLPWRRRARDNAPSPWVMAMIVVASAALVSLGRQLDQPVQLLSASAQVAGRANPTQGVYIGADSTDVFLGVKRRIESIPRSRVQTLVLGPPADREPSASLVSRILGGNHFAITPFEWWCNGQRYGWGGLGRLCRTQVQLMDTSGGLDGGFAPVKLRCPTSAPDGCRGTLRFVSFRRWQRGPAGLPLPIVFQTPLRPAGAPPGAEPVIAPGSTVVVCLPVDADQRGLLRNVAPAGHPRPERTVFFHLTVSEDPGGEDVVRRANFALTLPAPGDPVPRFGDCSRAGA